MKNRFMNFGIVTFLSLAMLLMSGCQTTSSYSGNKNIDIFSKPSTNPTLTGFYTEVLDSIHTEMIERPGETCALFMDFMSIYTFSPSVLQGNVLLGGTIPVTENFAIPLSYAMVFNWADEPYGTFSHNSYIGVIGTGGLIFHGKYGVLAGYAGYSWERTTEFYPDYGIDNDSSQGNVQWGIYPVINAKEYPLLQSFISLIDGFFSMDNLKMNRDEFKPNYRANVVFREILLSHSRWRISLSTYARKDWYDFMSKYNLYAGRVDFIFPNPFWWDYFILTLEGGYRDFFDVKQTTKIYENGAYINIAAKIVFNSYEKSGVMVYMESGSMSLLKNPIFGILLTIPLDSNFDVLAVFGEDKMDFGARVRWWPFMW